MKDDLSSWCAECHNAAKRGYRRRQKREELPEEIAAYEREAESATGWRADYSRGVAETLRRQAAREFA